VPHEEVLHEDHEGKKVILHQDPCSGERSVTYERYPERRYQFLRKADAAKRILEGGKLCGCYVEALDAKGFADAKHLLGAPGVRGVPWAGRMIIEVDVKMTDCILGGIGLSEVELKGEFSLSGGLEAEFRRKGETHVLGSANFEETVFGSRADLQRVVFHGPALFTEAKFRSRACFDRAAFLKKLGIRSARFEDGAWFWQCMFLDGVDFSHIEAEDIFNLLGACFMGDARFRGAAFRGIVGFLETTFLSEADFHDASFDKATDVRQTNARVLSFRNAIFRESLDLTRAGAELLTLDGLRCRDLYLMSVLGDVDLEDDRKELRERKTMLETVVENERNERPEKLREPQSLHQSFQRQREAQYLNAEEERLRRIEDLGRPFERISLQGLVVREKFVAPFHLFFGKEGGTQPAITGDVGLAGSWQRAANQYRWLKEQYSKEGHCQDEDEAHWWASECARRATTHSRRGLWCFALVPAVALLSLITGEAVAGAPFTVLALIVASCLAFPRFGKWLVFRKVFGYGVRPLNVLLAIAIVIVVFSALFVAAQATARIRPARAVPGQSAFASAVFNGLYLSVITFATAGYGGVSATGWAASCAMVEGMLGVVLNAALGATTFRKLVR